MRLGRPIRFAKRWDRRMGLGTVALIGALALCASAQDTGNGRKPSAILRDPFWPIGYRPGQTAMAGQPASGPTIPSPVEPGETDWEQARAKIRIQGITRRGDRVMAIVNDRVVGPGDVVEVSDKLWIFRWRIEEIGAAEVKLRREGWSAAAAPASPTGPGRDANWND